MIHKMMNGVSQWPRYSNTHSGEQFPTPYAYACVCVCVHKRGGCQRHRVGTNTCICVCVCVCVCVCMSRSYQKWNGTAVGAAVLAIPSRVKPNPISDHISPSLAFIFRSLGLLSALPCSTLHHIHVQELIKRFRFQKRNAESKLQ